MSAEVASVCYSYLDKAKPAKEDVKRLENKVTNTKTVLKNLQQLLVKQDESQLFANYTILDSVKRYFQELTGLKATQRASLEPSGEGFM
ncbi:hypothetical protein IQ06DRAFT_290510 [Phaeosphaeriaceae sp. SRC1lsM3a]|nr:hypothetical protein IQ06DRAFT_290510 [Stagonospora sp. SRC1lsM3a]